MGTCYCPASATKAGTPTPMKSILQKRPVKWLMGSMRQKAGVRGAGTQGRREEEGERGGGRGGGLSHHPPCAGFQRESRALLSCMQSTPKHRSPGTPAWPPGAFVPTGSAFVGDTKSQAFSISMQPFL